MILTRIRINFLFRIRVLTNPVRGNILFTSWLCQAALQVKFQDPVQPTYVYGMNLLHTPQ